MLALVLTVLLQGAITKAPDIALSSEGWDVPGAAEMQTMKPKHSWVAHIEGVDVRAERFEGFGRPKPVWLTTVRSTVDGISVWRRQVVAYQATRFSTAQGRVFCYRVVTNPYSEYGSIGADTEYAFSDLDGDGKFEAVEGVNGIVSVDKKPWQPRLPAR